MKTRKFTQKTTFKSLLSDLDRWYGSSWWTSGLVMLGIFIIAVILPGILG